MAEDKDPLKGLGAAIAVLVVGMGVGFLLLATVYTGPVWVKVLVFIAYLAVSAGLIRGTRRLKDSQDDKD